MNLRHLSVVLILALSILNVLLIAENFSLRRQLNSAGRLDASANALKPYQVQYARDGKKQLLMFFSPSCLYCVKQGPIWRDLLDRIDANRFNVVGIVGDREDKQQVTQHADGLGLFQDQDRAAGRRRQSRYARPLQTNRHAYHLADRR